MIERFSDDFEEKVSEKYESVEKIPVVQEAILFIESKLPKKYPELAGKFKEVLPYHGISHAKEVIRQAIYFALADGSFSERELELLGIAAAFHDAGYAVQYDRNEVFGADMAEDSMKKSGQYGESEIEVVKKAVLSTMVEFEPVFKQLIQEERIGRILADADTSNFGRENFFDRNKRVFQELEALGKIKDTDEGKLKFKEFVVHMLHTHKWNTEIAKNLREEQKQKNIQILEEGGFA